MGKPFKMKGHTLPGINQRSEGNTDLPDGRSGSAALQYRSPAKTEGHGGAKGHKHKPDTKKPHEMSGSINDKGTRVVNEKGNWVDVRTRPDLASKKQIDAQIKLGRKAAADTPAKHKKTKTVDVEHTHKAKESKGKTVKFPTREGYGGNIDWSKVSRSRGGTAKTGKGEEKVSD